MPENNDHNRVFRITPEDIERLRGDADLHSLGIAYASWLARLPELDNVVRQIEAAFSGQTLGDGIGLLEANGIDDYAGPEELAALRSRDEKADWRQIDPETLNRCYPAPSYFDARGFLFHLPAFLIAELKDQFDFGFIDRLIDPRLSSTEWICLLTPTQRDALVSTLRLVSDHPEYHEQQVEIAEAIARLCMKA